MSTTAALRQRATEPKLGAGVAEKKQLIREAEEAELTEGQKFVVPNFTIKELLDAIPAHCYKRSALKSSQYILQDFIGIALLGYGALHIESFLGRFNLSNTAFQLARAALWIGYWIMQSNFFTGIWIIAHECGHQAFSASKALNNAVGLVLHSLVLVPYHSWRISHGRHHASTGHLTRDEVFVPRTRKQMNYPAKKTEEEQSGINVPAWRQAELYEALGESPIASLYNLILHQLFGWPLYLIMNASGQLHYPSWTNHFQPSSVIFKDSQFWDIIISDLGLLAVISGLVIWGQMRSSLEVFLLYVIPYLGVNHNLVFITFLQHTDPLLPHYSDKEWTFARGALATIDRDFGFIGRHIWHGICETHVAHHTSSRLPHYNAWEATDALKEFLGPHYQSRSENMFVSFWKVYRSCIFVEEGEDVAFFKNAKGVAQAVGVFEDNQVSDSGVDLK